ncbi:MAG: hypothetical protein GXO67_08105 [Archaeoglobi archaeon]|nr:hypothetical protein [Archaeoglobi archaeon]
MRLFAALLPAAFLGFYYYTTQDYIPLAAFLSVYAGYEAVSRVERLSVVKPLLSFGMSVVFLRTALSYLNSQSDVFVYLLSAGIALAFSTSGLRYRHYLAVAGTAVIAASMLFMPANLPFSQYRLPIFAALAVLAVTSLLPILSERFEFLISERVPLILIVLVAGVYYLTLRPTLMPGLQSLGDWVIVAATLIYLVGKLRFEVEEVPIERSERLDFESMAERAEKEYVENGNPVPLIAFVTYNLAKAGVDVRSIESVLENLVERETIPKYAFGFEREMISRRRRKRRAEKFHGLRRKLEMIGGGYGD